MKGIAATGMSVGQSADPRHARRAVNRALARTGKNSATGVLLFLSPGFRNPSAAILEASRAAGCMQVSGCHGESLITEEASVVNVEGAVALVVHDPIHLSHLVNPPNPSVDFCSPESVSAAWLDAPARRFGAVASTTSPRQSSQVWSRSRRSANGHAKVFVHGARSAVGILHGIQPLTSPVAVHKTDGCTVLEIGRYPALNVLSQAIPGRFRNTPKHVINSEMLMGGIVFGDPDTAIASGRYHLNQVVAASRENRSITFSDKLVAGERVFLAISDDQAAQREMLELLPRLENELHNRPEFAVYLPGCSRQCDATDDQTLAIIKARYPGMPIAGFYGHGQITPLQTGSHLHYHCTGLGLFGT